MTLKSRIARMNQFMEETLAAWNQANLERAAVVVLHRSEEAVDDAENDEVHC